MTVTQKVISPQVGITVNTPRFERKIQLHKVVGSQVGVTVNTPKFERKIRLRKVISPQVGVGKDKGISRMKVFEGN